MIVRKITRAMFGSATGLIITLTVALSLCVWFFGPFLSDWVPLDTISSRAITIASMWGFALFVILILWILRRRRDRKMSEEIAEISEEDEAEEYLASELGELKGKLADAMKKLRKSKLGRQHLYQLPWYIMIGPPGAGKTTAIVNSGLKFPLSDDMGKSAVGGVGGTRNCDWWFTNDAVLIDTAGRYTTQDSDAEADGGAWGGFLALLKKYRKRQPINGALVAISLSDLSMQDEQTQASHAHAVRRRLAELREKLGVRFPIYFLFTKADLIAGFSEFYDSLGKEEREQVWGFTYDLKQSRSGKDVLGGFDAEFDRLLSRLNEQSLERMQQETDHQRRSMIAGFPTQVASLKQVARDFMAEVFEETRFEKRPMLRGVYFTSGTQEGTPIDRLMMGMAQTFGIGRQAIGSGQGSGRSFFLRRLFETVMFPESGLVSADDKVERRYKWITRGSIAASVIAAIGLGTVWTRSFMGNQDLVSAANASVAQYQEAATAIPPSPIGDTDLPALVPALNILRDAPGNPTINEINPEGRLKWGLYQGEVLGAQAKQTYRAALNTHLLPRLILRLEEQIQVSLNNPEQLYEALKIYLMLGLQSPEIDSTLIKDWMTVDWSQSYPGTARAGMRADLSTHLKALIENPMEPVALNQNLIEQVQTILAQMPLAQRIYNGIVNSQKAKNLQMWRLSDAGGPAINRVFVRSSGRDLTEGVPGVYTYKGFNSFFLAEALGVARRMQKESWVLGPFGEAQQSDQALANLSRDVLGLYYDDYVEAYDKLLSDIDIIPLETISHAVEVINILQGSTSPIAKVLQGIADETRLTETRSTVNAGAEAIGEGLADVGSLELRSSLGVQEQILLDAILGGATASNGEPPPPPGGDVERRFGWLQQLVAGEDNQPSQLDDYVGVLATVYRELNKKVLGSSGASEEGSALALLGQTGDRLEGPLPRWSKQIVEGASGITAEGTRAQLNAKWQSQVLPFCEQALTDRYPFTARSRADVSIQDFSRVFAPNGLIDTFFTENLLKYVDTRARPWAWKQVNTAELGISPAVLQQMQYAAEIRDTFFAGGPEPTVSFELTPYALDSNAEAVAVEVGGQVVRYKHGDRVAPSALKWPGDVGIASVGMHPPAANSESGIVRDGPWAWFRLLSAAEVRNTNVPDRSRLIFNVGGRIAQFQLRAGSVLNPFSLPALTKFQCPKSL